MCGDDRWVSVVTICHSGSSIETVNSRKSCSLTVFMMLLIFSEGYVLEKRPGQNSDVEVSNFVSRAEFQNITYWNHDTTPSAEDSLPRCFHWLTVANAVSIYRSVSCPIMQIHFDCLYFLWLAICSGS